MKSDNESREASQTGTIVSSSPVIFRIEKKRVTMRQRQEYYVAGVRPSLPNAGLSALEGTYSRRANSSSWSAIKPAILFSPAKRQLE
jgi:hypothetical protein